MSLPLTPTQAVNAAKVLASWATGMDLDIAPLQIDFEPTNRCNLRCRFCPNRLRERPHGALDPRLFARVVDETASTTLEYHLDMIGEPLLHPALPAMLDHAGRRGARVVLFTNLSVQNDALIRALARSPLDRILVNLCTTDLESYRRIYGRAALGPVLHNLSLLRDARGRSPRPRIVVSWLRVQGPPPPDLPVDDVQVHAPHDWLGTSGLDVQAPPPRPRPLWRCTRPWASASILWDGRVATCCYDHAGIRILADLRHTTLLEAWNSPEIREFRRNHRALDPCRGCVDPDPQVSMSNLWFLVANRLSRRRPPSIRRPRRNPLICRGLCQPRPQKSRPQGGEMK